MLNLSVVCIRWQQFLANTFPPSFKVLYDHEQLFWLTIPSFSQRFFLSVPMFLGYIWAIFNLRFWVTVGFSGATLSVDAMSKGKVVLNLWHNHFSVGEVLFLSGFEFGNNMPRKWSSELSFTLLRDFDSLDGSFC